MMSPGGNRLCGLFSRTPWLARWVYTSLGNIASPLAGDFASMSRPRDFTPQPPRRRADRIARIRREIQLGIYETPEKWALALDRLCGELERLAREAEEEDFLPLPSED
jgi:hypothetical protein